MKKCCFFNCAILALLMLNLNAYGTVTSIDIISEGTYGDFTPPYPFESTSYTIVKDGYNDDTLWVWKENQNIILDVDLYVDWVANPNEDFIVSSGDGYLIKKGTIVSSHYVQWDPAGIKRIEATIHFDSAVFAYIYTTAALVESDNMLGLENLNYSDFNSRGIEPAPNTNNDILQIGDIESDIYVNWLASSGDWARVITAYSPSASECSQAELDAQFEAGKQYCIDNPEACGIHLVGECSQADLDTAEQNGYDKGYQAGVSSCDDSIPPISSDKCATFDVFSNTFHVPCFNGGLTMYWLDWELSGSDPIMLELKDIGTN